MSKVIDEKVVSMQFDNSNFESNVKTTMSTLDKLKQSLNLKGASQGLENVSEAAKKVDVSPLSKGVETVQAKFSAMEIVGITALANITNSAVNAAKNIVNMFAIAPVTTGFSEYELKMGSVQTIMASTGATLETVNGYLEELNSYADKTIYSFSDMTNNIGKFTNAGVSLDKAVLAIKGVSNEAAISGANAAEASRAMYNFAQALSAGYVKLIDWKSIENANMATVEFKNQLLETALAMGTVVREGDKYRTTTTDATGNVSELFNATSMFNESLSNQWMTTEVLTQTLSNYAQDVRTMTDVEREAYEAQLKSVGYTEEQIKKIEELGTKAFDSAQDVKTFSMMMDTLKEAAQSGWAQTWEIIVGDFNQAKQFWTSITEVFSSIIDGMSQTRNAFLKNVLGGKGADAWKEVAQEVEKAGISIDDFKSKLIEVGKEHGVITDEMISEAGSFEASLTSGWLSFDIVSEVINSFVDSAGEAQQVTEDMTDTLEYFQDVVNRVWRGDFYNGAERINALTEAGYDYYQVQELVNKTVDGHRLTLEDLSIEQARSVGFTEEQIEALQSLKKQAEETGTPLNKLINDLSRPSGRTLLLESFSHIFEQIQKIIQAVKDGFDGFLGDFNLSEFIYNAIVGFHDFITEVEVGDSVLSAITSTIRLFTGSLNVVATLTTPVFGLFKKIFNLALRTLGLDFWGFMGRLADLVNEFNNWILKNNELVKSVTDTVDSIISVAEEKFASLKKMVGDFVEKIGMYDFLDKFKTSFVEAFDNLVVWIKGFGPLIADFIDDLKSLDEISLDSIGTSIVIFAKKVFDRILGIGDNFTSLFEAIESFRDSITKYFREVGADVSGFGVVVTDTWEKIYGFLKSIKDKIAENFGFAEVFAVVTGAAIIMGAFKFLGIVEKFTKQLFKLSDGLNSVFTGISSMFKSFGEADKIRAKGEAIRNFAIAIGILAVSFYVLSRVDSDKVGQAVAILAGLMIAMLTIVYVLGKVGEVSVDIYAGASAFLMLAGSLAIFALSLKLMESLDPVATVINLGILIGAIIAMTASMRFLSGKDPVMLGTSIALIALATGILIFSKSLQIMSEMDPVSLAGSILAMIAVMSSLFVFAGIVGKSGPYAAKAGVAIMAVSASLLIMVAAIKLIAKLGGEEVIKAITIIALIETLFAGIMLATRLAGKNAAKAGAMMIGFSVALLLMVGVVKAINTLTKDEIEKAIDILFEFSKVFALIIAASLLAGKYAIKAGIMLAGAAGAMLLVSAAMVVLSHVKPEGLKQAEIAISVIGAIFAALIVATHFANLTKDSFKPMVAMIVAIGSLVIAVAVLSTVDSDGLFRATVSIAVLMISLAGVFEATGKIALMSKGLLGSMAAIIAMIGFLTGIVVLLGQCDSTNSITNAISLSLLVLALSASMLILSKTTPLAKGALPGMVALSGVVALLAAVLGALSYFNVNPSLETAGALSLLLLSLSVCCVILSSVGATGPAAFLGIGALATLIAAIGGIMIGLGALATYYPQVEEFLNKGLPMLELIGTGLGAFFGGIVSGFTNASTNDLEKTGDKLSKFMTNMKPFLDGANEISEETVAGVGLLADAIFKISASNLLDSAAKFIDGESSLASFGEQLAAFGVYLKMFGASVSGLDTESITSAATASQSLSDLVNSLPGEDGIAQSILGSKNLSTFGSTLKQFGTGLKDYSEEVKGLDVEAITSSAPAGQALSDLANSLPGEEGLAQTILGSKNLSTFGSTLKQFGTGLKEYGVEVENLPVDSIVSSVSAGTALSDLANALPSADGFAQSLLGSKDVGQFGEKLKSFGSGMKTYADSVKDLNTESIYNSVTAATALSDVAKALPDSESWVNTIFGGGKETLASFGDNLSTFGNSLQAFSGYEIDSDKISSSASAANELALISFPEDTGSMNGFGSAIKSFGEKLRDYAYAISGVDMGSVSNSIKNTKDLVKLIGDLAGLDASGISGFQKALDELSKINLDGFISTFDNASSKMTTAATNMFSAFTSSTASQTSSVVTTFNNVINAGIISVNNMSPRFKESASKLMLQFNMGVIESGTYLKLAISTLLNNCISGAYTHYNSFNSAGKYLGEGLVTGINYKKTAAYNAGYALGQSSAQGVKDGAKEKSPSKLTYQYGKWVGEGLVNGMQVMGKAVYSAGETMGDKAVLSVSKALELIGDSDLDVQPTIRPVLDLSDVQSGAGVLNGMFGGMSLGVATNVGSISAMMNRRSQNGVNDDVISAINNLRRDLGSLEKPTYNINGITYDDGSNISNAVQDIVRAARIERRI